MGQRASTPANSGQQSPRLRTFSSSSTGATDTTPQTLAAPSQGFSFLRSLPGLQQQPQQQQQHQQQQSNATTSTADRQRARSLSSVPDIQQQVTTDNNTHPAASATTSSNLNGSTANNNNANTISQRRQLGDALCDTMPRASILESIALATSAAFSTTSSSNSTARVYNATSLPSHMWSLNGIKCPVCSKFVLPDDIECHLVMCLTKPRLSYNEDILNDAKGECVICLEDMNAGDLIARLPCLCIYHKSCIDRWFQVNRSCPEHPSD